MVNYIFDPHFQNLSLAGRVVSALERISEAYRLTLLKQAKTADLTPTQIQILVFMKFHKKLHASLPVLAKELNLPIMDIYNETISMVSKNLISQTNQTDGNTNNSNIEFVLTPRGSVCANKHSLYANELLHSLGNFQETDLENYYFMTLKLIASLQKNDLLSENRMCLSCKFLEKQYVHSASKPHDAASELKAEEVYFCGHFQRKLDKKNLRIDCDDFEIHQVKPAPKLKMTLLTS